MTLNQHILVDMLRRKVLLIVYSRFSSDEIIFLPYWRDIFNIRHVMKPLISETKFHNIL